MLRATSRPEAPWYAIPADDKDYMRAAVARILVETLERIGPAYPKLDAAQRRELQEGRKRLARGVKPARRQRSARPAR